MRAEAILLAGGAGDRFGAEEPKQFVRLAGEEILTRSLRAIATGVERIVVVSNPAWMERTEHLVGAASIAIPTLVVPGGATRNESTRNGLAALDNLWTDRGEDRAILVHDAVRPLLPLEVLTAALEPVLSGRAHGTDTVIPSSDTLVIVEGEQVVDIPDRRRFRRGQTPQVFLGSVLRAAYAAAAAAGDLGATDDCTLVLRYVPTATILAVSGAEVNLKITTRIDMVLADRMLQMQTIPPQVRADPARLAGARMFIVGGTNGIGLDIATAARDLQVRVEVGGRSSGLDVRDYVEVERRVNEVAANMGGLEHVVVTAGVLRLGSLSTSSPADLAEMIDVNLTGSINVARAAHPHLRATQGSLTLFTSSSFTRGRAGYVAYSASKAAVVNLAQGLAEEWAPDRVRVNAVSPERTDTPMRRRAFPGESADGLLSSVDVAAATLRLIASDLTGQVVDIKRHDARPEPVDRHDEAVVSRSH